MNISHNCLLYLQSANEPHLQGALPMPSLRQKEMCWVQGCFCTIWRWMKNTHLFHKKHKNMSLFNKKIKWMHKTWFTHILPWCGMQVEYPWAWLSPLCGGGTQGLCPQTGPPNTQVSAASWRAAKALAIEDLPNIIRQMMRMVSIHEHTCTKMSFFQPVTNVENLWLSPCAAIALLVVKVKDFVFFHPEWDGIQG